jgi:soluble lytic murein transglycosylase
VTLLLVFTAALAGAAADGAEVRDLRPDARLGEYLDRPVPAAAARTQVADALRRGLSEGRAGRVEVAELSFQLAERAWPGIADWTALFRAEAVAMAGDTARLRRLVAELGEDLRADWSWELLSRARLRAGDTLGAAQAAEAGSREARLPARRSGAWARLGELRLARGDTARAVAAYREAATLAPRTQGGKTALDALAALPFARTADGILVGRGLLERGELPRGIELLTAYVEAAAAPGARIPAARRDSAALELGRALFRARRYPEAERRLAPVVRSGDPALAAEALFFTGRSQYRQGRHDAGKATLRQVAERFPGVPAHGEALFMLGDLESDDARLDVAEPLFRRLLAEHPGTVHAEAAAMRLGGLQYVRGDFAGAARTFETYIAGIADDAHCDRPCYWSARAHLRLGGADNEARAQRRLARVRQSAPINYYGARAADRLGEGFLAALPAAPASTPATAGRAAHGVARVELLGGLGRADAVHFERERLRRFFAGEPGGLYAFAEAKHAAGDIYNGIMLGREIQRRDGWNERSLRLVYPFPHRDLVVRESRARGLDPYLVAGLIRQESMWSPNARSPVGALGLMQVMPATARQIGRRAGLAAGFERRLTAPDVNVRLGTFFLAERLRAYDGNLVEALAAYNAGPTRVVRWRAFPEHRDMDVFTERIPFQETRDYVKIVGNNARIYRALYGGN